MVFVNAIHIFRVIYLFVRQLFTKKNVGVGRQNVYRSGNEIIYPNCAYSNTIKTTNGTSLASRKINYVLRSCQK